MQKTVGRFPNCEDKFILDIWQSVKEKYPSKKYVRVVCTSLDISPLITGLRHPIILLPTYAFSQSEYQMILEHEMLHCIRHDVVIKITADILCTVYWWNPLFYLLRSKIFELIEIGNDRQLTKSFSIYEKAAYMQCLTDTARKICGNPVPFTLSFGRADQKSLRRRIDVIGYARPVRRMEEIIVLVILILLLWSITSFTFEPYNPPEEPYITLDKNNCYIVHNENAYDIYYQNELYYTVDSIDYFNPNIPIYEKEEINENNKLH